MVICESGSYYLKLKIWLFIADFYDKKSYLHEILFPISNMGLSGEQFGVPITFIENFMGRNFNTWKSLDEPLVVGFHLILANPRNKKMYKISLGFQCCLLLIPSVYLIFYPISKILYQRCQLHLQVWTEQISSFNQRKPLFGCHWPITDLEPVQSTLPTSSPRKSLRLGISIFRCVRPTIVLIRMTPSSSQLYQIESCRKLN